MKVHVLQVKVDSAAYVLNWVKEPIYTLLMMVGVGANVKMNSAVGKHSWR